MGGGGASAYGGVGSCGCVLAVSLRVSGTAIGRVVGGEVSVGVRVLVCVWVTFQL